jgi:hypothetical protein
MRVSYKIMSTLPLSSVILKTRAIHNVYDHSTEGIFQVLSQY